MKIAVEAKDRSYGENGDGVVCERRAYYASEKGFRDPSQPSQPFVPLKSRVDGWKRFFVPSPASIDATVTLKDAPPSTCLRHAVTAQRRFPWSAGDASGVRAVLCCLALGRPEVAQIPHTRKWRPRASQRDHKPPSLWEGSN
ncbi:hypothetical protein IMZ48_45215 [Candidatus Bathyarchaeota archaeon]|nr:hypothetical protein [Candidatus Bathyarchaeota archaeon]